MRCFSITQVSQPKRPRDGCEPKMCDILLWLSYKQYRYCVTFYCAVSPASTSSNTITAIHLLLTALTTILARLHPNSVQGRNRSDMLAHTRSAAARERSGGWRAISAAKPLRCVLRAPIEAGTATHLNPVIRATSAAPNQVSPIPSANIVQ